MEYSIFRLAVIAVVAVALILIGISLFPYFRTDILSEMNAGLDYAQANIGKANSIDLFFEEGFGTKASGSLNTPSRNTTIKCNNPAVCNEQGIIADNEGFYIAKSISATVSTRCDYSVDIYICTVYLGELPAQLELGEVDYKEIYDVSRESADISVIVKNTGKLAAYNVETTAKVYLLSMQEGEIARELYQEPIVVESESIAARSSRRADFTLPITRNASYSVEIRSAAQESGFDETSFEIEITGGGIVETCNATQEGETTLSAGNCRKKYLCTGCGFAFECKLKWNAKQPSKEFEIADPGFAIIEYEAIDGGCEENGNNGNNGNGNGNGEENNDLVIDGRKLTGLVEEKYNEYKSTGAGTAMLAKSAQYEATIRNVANAKGINANLIKAIIATESAFNENAVSGAGAIGLMQIMQTSPNHFCHAGYATVAAKADESGCIPEAERTDKEINIALGAEIFLFFYNYSSSSNSHSIRDCQQRKALALAAYNGGQTKIEDCTIKSDAPQETKNYLVKVLAYERIFSES